jgi:predicted CxxxxCH...CXXCH cytochrome family protein
MCPDLGKWLLAAGVIVGAQGCLDAREDARVEQKSACTPCHGDNQREGSDLDKAAPPFDLSGKSDPGSRGVGAHQIHLTASATHGKIACNECHVVPESVDSPGHADDPYPAELTFGALATSKGFVPSYDDKNAYTCSSTYCHRDADPKWTAPRSSEEACGTCHGLPPAVVVVNASTGATRPHPQAKNCDACHPNVIRDGDKWTFKDPSKHVNGVAEVDMPCNACHGNPNNDAPPKDLAGNLERTAIGVGAHQEHLAGGKFSRAVECNECHIVPASVEDPGHLDDTPFAELTFSGVAVAFSSPAAWDRGSETCAGSWCHGPKLAASVSPKWTSTAGLGCTDCHGYPPPAPHPQMSRCSLCHTKTVGADNVTIADRTLHVNGTVDHEMPTACNACHGSAASSAPPVDLAGNTAISARGVGAHQAHLKPLDPLVVWRRPVECSDCHLVPQSVFDPGHFDSSPPAELTFSSVATGLPVATTPSFDGITCSGVWCHGATLGGGEAAWKEPVWTSPLPKWWCGSCHGFPPPSHQGGFFDGKSCGQCHSATMTGYELTNPGLHINGTVDILFVQ